MNYEKLLEESLKLKEKVLNESVSEKEIISFGGIKLHKKIDFSLFSNDKLLLAHACVHTLYSKKNDFVKPGLINEMHNKIVNELKNRSLKHEKFDKLDYF